MLNDMLTEGEEVKLAPKTLRHPKLCRGVEAFSNNFDHFRISSNTFEQFRTRSNTFEALRTTTRDSIIQILKNSEILKIEKFSLFFGPKEQPAHTSCAEGHLEEAHCEV